MQRARPAPGDPITIESIENDETRRRAGAKRKGRR